MWTPGAREVFRAFHNESIRLRNGCYRDIEGDLGRWRENAIRIGNGLVIADSLTGHGEDCIGTEEQAQRAVRIMDWCAKSCLAIVNEGRVARQLERVEDMVGWVKRYGGRVSLRDLRLRHGFKAEEVKNLVGLSSGQLCLLEEQNPKGGPRSEILTLMTAKP